MVLNDRDRRALRLGGIVLAALAVYFLGIEPLWGWYAGRASEHSQASEKVARAVARQRKADSYAQLVADWESRAGRLTPPGPYARQVTEVSGRIMSAAQRAGVQIKGTTPTAPAVWPDDPALQRASILIEADAEWESVFRFIGGLYQSEGILSVEEMDLTGDAKQGGRLNLKLTVSFMVQAQAGGGRWSS